MGGVVEVEKQDFPGIPQLVPVHRGGEERAVRRAVFDGEDVCLAGARPDEDQRFAAGGGDPEEIRFPDQFQFSGGADEVAVPGIKHSFAADRRAFKLSDQFLFGRFRAEVPVIASVGRNPGGIPEFCHQHERIAKPRQRFRFRINSGRIFRHDERCGNF